MQYRFPNLGCPFFFSFFLTFLMPPTAFSETGGRGFNIQMIDLSPTILWDNEWVPSESCQVQKQNTQWECLFSMGRLTIQYMENGFNPTFTSTQTGKFGGISYQGELKTNSPKASFLSHGYQSWSPSGWLKIGQPKSIPDLKAELNYNDETRDGKGLSRGFSILTHGNNQHLLIGATTSNHFKNWVQWSQATAKASPDKIKLTFGSGASADTITLKTGGTLKLESWRIERGHDSHYLLDEYKNNLDFYPHMTAPTIGWNSWYNYWDNVREQDILANAKRVQEILSSIPPQEASPTIVIDDGWERTWGDWIPNEKFPNFSTLAATLEAQGFTPGIWIAPFLVSKNSYLYNNEDWFIKGEGAIFHHPTGSYKILDITNPEVADHITRTIRGLVSQGFDFLKIDFLMVGAYEGKRYLDITATAAYHRGLKLIRNAAGPSTYLLACGAPILESLPYVNSIRIGPDIAYKFPGRPAVVDIALTARSLASRYFLCDKVHCDADPLLLRSPHTHNTRQLAAWVAASAGGGLFLSDNLTKLDTTSVSPYLNSNILQVATKGKALIPKPLPYENLRKRLYKVRPGDRIFGISRVRAPEVWHTPEGLNLRLNFDRRSKVILNRTIEGRSGLLGAREMQ